MDEHEILQIQEQYHHDIIQRIKDFDPTIKTDSDEYISIPEVVKIIKEVSEDYQRVLDDAYPVEARSRDYEDGNFKPVHMACEFERELDHNAQDFKNSMQRNALLSPAAMERTVGFELNKQSKELHKASERSQEECKELYDQRCNALPLGSIVSNDNSDDIDPKGVSLTAQITGTTFKI